MHTLCRKCAALCCRNLAIQIYRPRTHDEIEDLKWQLQFDRVQVFIRHKRWYQLIESTCMYLSKDNQCTVYDTRPSRCRTYSRDNCEHHGPFYEVLLFTPQALEAYLASLKKKNPKKKKASGKSRKKR